jgi:monoamine oxidase
VQADLQEISSYEYDESLEFVGGPNSDLTLEDGYSTLIERLAGGIEIHLGSYVKSVASTRHGVTITDKYGDVFTASSTIVSVPIGVLKANNMEFSPPLPLDLRHAISDLGLSDTIKMGLCWKPEDVFWPSGGPRTLHFHKYAQKKYQNTTTRYGRGEHIEFINLHELYGSGCLLVEAETEFATKLSKMKSNKERADRIMEDVCLMFPKGCVYPTRGVVVSDWATSPTTLGGFAHWRVDTGRDENELFASSDIHWGRVMFAGEHTSWKYFGNTHGAYISGVTAAQRVVDAFEWRRLQAVVVTVVLSLSLTWFVMFKIS